MKSIPPSWHWKERALPKPGAKPNLLLAYFVECYGVHRQSVWEIGIDRLCNCADDAAIRLLLGVSR